VSRLALHLLASLVTFSVGVAVTSMLPIRQRTAPGSSRRIALEVTESTVHLNLDLAAPEFTFAYDPKKFNPRGDYFIIGPKPKAFREFFSLELAVDDDIASGHVGFETYANNTCNSGYTVFGQVTNKSLTFVASPLSEDDYEYSFAGYFLRGGTVASAGKRTAVLKGRLRKSKRGVTVAESEVKFRIEYLGC
jgi:hypothetical protein